VPINISDVLEVLFPYIVFLYIIDSIILVSRNHIFFTTFLGNKFSIKKEGFTLAGLSPLGQSIASDNFPIHITEKGVYYLREKISFQHLLYDPELFSFIAYENIFSLEVIGKTLKINGTINIANFSSHTSANKHKDLVIHIKDSKPFQYSKIMNDHFFRIYDFEAVKELKESCSKELFELKFFSSFLFINTFIMIPIFLYSGTTFNFSILLIYMLILYIILIIYVIYSYRKIYKPEDRQFGILLMPLILLPINAMHILNTMTKDAFAKFDFVTISAEFLPPYMFKKIIRKELLRIEEARKRNNNKELGEFWNFKYASLLILLHKVGVKIQDVMKSPPKSDELADSYCPLCDSEYRAGCLRCNECDTELKKY
tara:strand:- start:45 stop:1157 length:1113 start_codon:yes stop_codon:yes gene_type:complete